MALALSLALIAAPPHGDDRHDHSTAEMIAALIAALIAAPLISTKP